MAEFALELEPLCEVEVYVTEPIPIGPSSCGTRVILPLGGEGTGKRLNGRIRSFGGDWGVIRPDNCFELDVRIVIETDDGATIYWYYRGLVAMTPEQAERALIGDLSDRLDLYVTPRFESCHESYQWLSRVQAVGRGTAQLHGDRMRVAYSWYTLTN